jgi:hypothetical protein
MDKLLTEEFGVMLELSRAPMDLFLFHFHAFQTPTKIKFSVKFPLASSKHFCIQKEAMFGSKGVDSLEI